VGRRFNPPALDQLWVADFTYVPTWSGMVYVAFVIDACSRRILGWRAATRMRTELVLDALEHAVWTRVQAGSTELGGLIMHTGAGSQYTSIAYTERLAVAGAAPSVGTVGDAYDNALAESTIGLFKTELIKPRGPWRSVEQVEIATLEYVDWFNHRRLHSAAGDIPPAELRPPTTVNEQPHRNLSAQAISPRTRRGGSVCATPAASSPSRTAGPFHRRHVNALSMDPPPIGCEVVGSGCIGTHRRLTGNDQDAHRCRPGRRSRDNAISGGLPGTPWLGPVRMPACVRGMDMHSRTRPWLRYGTVIQCVQDCQLSASSAGARGEQLMLTPRVYRDNVFLHTGLPVDAGSKEIRRYRARAHAAGNLTPEVEKLLDELQRDPNRRIVQELFAPWRSDGSPAPPPGVSAELCATHDRAVEAHRTALDLELDGSDPAVRDDAWQQALTMWAALLYQKGVWDRLRDRAAAIADPRLTAADVERLRVELPDLLLGINARLAADGHAPARHRALMETFATMAYVDAAQVDAVLARTVQEVLDRVDKACDEARDKAGASRSGGLHIVSELDTEVRDDLARIRTVLGDRHPAAVRVRDRAAETYRRCVVQHLNARRDTGDPAALPFLRTALDLAASSDVKGRVRMDLDTVQEALEAGHRQPSVLTPPGMTSPRREAVPRETASVGGPWFFIVLGIAAMASGLGWWGGPWLAVAGAVVHWLALGSLKRALMRRPDALGRSCLTIGVVLAILGSLPFGGLWPETATGLWGMGHAGMWLVGFGVVRVLEGALYLSEATYGIEVKTASWGLGATVYVGGVWLAGDGGWPAFVVALVLALVTLAAFGGAQAEALMGMVSLGVLLTLAAVGIVAGIQTIGVVLTLIATLVALIVLVAIGRAPIVRSAQ
jgi:putative transposase